MCYSASEPIPEGNRYARSHHFLRVRSPLFLCSVLPVSIFAGATEASATPWPLAFVLVEIVLLLEIRLTTACGTSRVESQWYAVLGVAAKEIRKVGVAHGHGDDHATT